MMTRKRLDAVISELDPLQYKDVIKLLCSVRDSQTTADGKIAIPGDKVYHIARGSNEIKADIVDTPFTWKNGRQIHCTYSSEAALKQAVKKASKQ